MYELKTDGIVLGKYNINDNDEVVILFTEKKGKIFVKTKSTKKILSKIKSTLEIFSFNNYYLIKKNNQTKYFRLIQAVPIKIYENIRGSLDDIFICFLFVQLINKFTALEDPHLELYETTEKIFDLIDKKVVNHKIAEIFFKIKLLKFTGFNIKDNESFLEKEKISNNLKNFLLKIEETDSINDIFLKPENLHALNKILNNYIKDILNEDLSCLKLMNYQNEF